MFLRGETIAKEMPRWRDTPIFSKTGVSLFLQIFARKDVSLPCKELYTINYKTIDLN